VRQLAEFPGDGCFARVEGQMLAFDIGDFIQSYVHIDVQENVVAAEFSAAANFRR